MVNLKSILEDRSFDCKKHLIMNIKEKSGNDERFSTKYTLCVLDFDMNDVVEVLKSLEVSDYSETLVDRDNGDPPKLYVFEKIIERKSLYIKIKIREKQVVCISFHFSKYALKHPYN